MTAPEPADPTRHALDAAIADAAEAQRIETRLAALGSEVEAARSAAAEATARLAAERRDVQRLEGASFASLWSTVANTRGERLAEERTQAQLAQYAADQAKDRLGRLERELAELQHRLSRLGDVEFRYERALQDAGGDVGAAGAEGAAVIARLRAFRELREVEEALVAGQQARDAPAPG